MGSLPRIASWDTRHFSYAMLDLLRFWIYNLLKRPSGMDHIRTFRFGIPLIVKRSQFAESNETAALRFLYSTGLNLPIPCNVDSLFVKGHIYTIMTVLPGDTMIGLYRRDAIRHEEVEEVIEEVLEVVRKLSPLPTLQGLVGCNSVGRGLPF